MLLNQHVSAENVVLIILKSLEYRRDVVAADYVTQLGRTTPPTLAELDYWAGSPLDLLGIRLNIDFSPEFYFHWTGTLPIGT